MADNSFGPVNDPRDRIVLDSLSQVSQLFLADLKSWIEQSGVLIPVNQIAGFAQFTAKQSPTTFDTGDETRNSATYGDLATVGPLLTGLRPGNYIFLFGFSFAAATSDTGRCSLSINGSVPVDADAVIITDTLGQYKAGSRALVKENVLTSDTNTVKMQYADSGTQASNFRFRWLVALRYA